MARILSDLISCPHFCGTSRSADLLPVLMVLLPESYEEGIDALLSNAKKQLNAWGFLTFISTLERGYPASRQSEGHQAGDLWFLNFYVWDRTKVIIGNFQPTQSLFTPRYRYTTRPPRWPWLTKNHNRYPQRLTVLFLVPLTAWFFVRHALLPEAAIAIAEPFIPLWQFQIADQLSGATLIAGVVMLLAICALGVAAFTNRQVQYLSFVTGWQFLRLFCAIEVLAQGTLLVWLAFWLSVKSISRN